MRRTISSGTLDEGEAWEGRFREDDETVVGNRYVEDEIYHNPPRHTEIEGMLKGLCEFVNNESERMHPFIKGIILHYMIGYIHPFVDGNGRVARSLFYWYVIKKGYWMMEFTAVSKAIKESAGRYGLAYRYAETDGNDPTYFIDYNLECIRKAVRELEKYIERKAKERRDASRLVENNPELNIREATILKTT